ncbi:HlyD family secretion protein [Shewanella gaetbuli]|uniref:HlyD family secretion protein n=1 Tax=Shewanella gaetbuli TaxID=220752 RepID=A0A9X1ZLM1_9GAMM|nr:HlyD family secretion protein [Shewanella gaetbuli]MCL1143816.1 HlyD family secretion protein [Shewanella gaetbuli]
MIRKYITSLLLIGFAALGIYHYYLHYQSNPWTRDGQVRAHIIQVTPQVTGQVVAFEVADNQEVSAGDVLFRIDDRKYIADFKSAQASVKQAQAALNKALNEQHRAKALEKRVQGSVSTLTLNNYQSAVESAQANLDATMAKKDQAQLALQYTVVTAPVDGFVTNLNYRVGSQVVANAPVVALIDKHSFWIEGFFKETDVKNVRLDQPAKVTLMTDDSEILNGTVESIGYGISKSDGSTGNSLLPNVNPNFQWIRLAQRLPVKIKLDEKHAETILRVGMTASVQIIAE